MKTIAEQITEGLDRFYKAFQRKRVLKSLEEISATTNEDDVASAVAVAALNNNLGGCSLEQEGTDFFIVGADAVRKKLGEYKKVTVFNGYSYAAQSINITPYTANYKKLTINDFVITKSKLCLVANGAALPDVLQNILGSYNASTGILNLNQACAYAGPANGTKYSIYIEYSVAFLDK